MSGGRRGRAFAWLGVAFLILAVARFLVGNDVLHWWAHLGY